ncbi:MBL fold metallo-hydrolase [Micromonospora sp. NPDC049230]|uniref:MBL fold metallo-hydrolase n=1 Tax=Micromonospora sp. NPDC049230 TaxID=3155502 RepID=UPI0033ECB290
MSLMAGASRTDGPSGSQQLVEIADGVFAYLQLPGGWCVSNAGAVSGPETLMVVDTLATEQRARRLHTALSGIGGPRRLVVNTHHHGDHNFGNHVFDTATVVAHEQARVEMAETGLALTGLWPDVSWGDVRVTLPTLTFRDRATVHLGDRVAELVHVGPAHTTNDVLVWLPDTRVLFAGDVLLSGAAPFNLMGSVSGAVTALQRIRELDPRVIVCGHGPLAGPEVIDENLAYLRWIQQLAEEGAALGMSPLETALSADRSAFDHLLDPERIVGNLHRAYAELTDGPLGRPLDVVSVFGEMVAFNDGRLPACFA